MGGDSVAGSVCVTMQEEEKKIKSKDSGLFTGELKSLLFTTGIACLSPLSLSLNGGTQQW